MNEDNYILKTMTQDEVLLRLSDEGKIVFERYCKNVKKINKLLAEVRAVRMDIHSDFCTVQRELPYIPFPNEKP